MTIRLVQGDALDVLRTLPDASVHAVVCDPPYGLAEHGADKVAEAVRAWTSGDREYTPVGKGFMGRSWDAFVPPPAVWDECYRVLRPGGYLVAFAGSRTYWLMGLSIALAGLEVRDGLTWLYGSGFPKGINVGKAIDKVRDDRADILRVTAFVRAARNRAGLRNADVDAALGVSAMCDHWCRSSPLQAMVPTWGQWLRLRELLGFGDEMDGEVWRLNGRKGTPGEAWSQREVVGQACSGIGAAFGDGEWAQGGAEQFNLTAPYLPEAQRWDGWNTALKPAHEPIVLARRPLSGAVAHNVLEYGTGALNVDACRTGTVEVQARVRMRSTGSDAGIYDHGRGGSATACESHPVGRWPANVLLSHGPDCHPPGECGDGCPVAELDAQSGVTLSAGGSRGAGGQHGVTSPRGAQPEVQPGYGDTGGASRFFATFDHETTGCAPGCPVAELDAQSGVTTSSSGGRSGRTVLGVMNDDSWTPSETRRGGHDDTGGASRFFPTLPVDADPGFRYQAKAPSKERPKVDGKGHPTVKPLALMQWLVRLVTPPGGTIVDPFAGSGTTGQAAEAEGFDAVLIDRDTRWAQVRLGVEPEVSGPAPRTA